MERARLLPILPAPLRRAAFRRLWLGMTTSYAGDRLQALAQGWLIAALTGSALGVGLITVLGSLPLLLLPVGGVIAEQVDRRRLLLAGQLIGAATTLVIAALVLAHRVAIWHIYAWAFVNSLIVLVSRPAYKVVLTEAVPSEEVRPAVALNSITETASLVLVNGAGSLVLALLGLPLAFIVNAASYLVAAGSLWSVSGAGIQAVTGRRSLRLSHIPADLRDGLVYLAKQPALFGPLLLTFAMIVVSGPVLGLLAAIVHAQGGSIVDLGRLGAAVSAGSLGGAICAGTRGAGANELRSYTRLGLVAAVAVARFALVPSGSVACVALATIGFIAFAEAVWNTSRIRQLAAPSYQARLQAITSMAFTLGFTVGTLWAGIAVDRLGLVALLGGAAALAACSLAVVARQPLREHSP